MVPTLNAAYSPMNSMALTAYTNHKSNWEYAKVETDNFFKEMREE